MDVGQAEPARYLEVAEESARIAGTVALAGFKGALDIRSKGGKDIVTQFDTAAEEAAIGVIHKAFPTHAILGEESGASGWETQGDSNLRWAIDPIDGTHNYAMQLPFWCSSVALTDAATGKVLVGVVYDPVHEELFTATLGQGAYLNGERIQVSDTTDPGEAVLTTDIGYEPDIARRMLVLAGGGQPHVKRLRLLGSAVLAMSYVAAGRFDSYYHLSLQPWDIAAASLLVAEAGGRITDWDGTELASRQTGAVAANPTLYPQILQLLHEGDKG